MGATLRVEPTSAVICMGTRRMSLSITTETARWTTSTVTTASMRETRKSFSKRRKEWSRSTPSLSAELAFIPHLADMDLLRTSTCADTARDGTAQEMGRRVLWQPRTVTNVFIWKRSETKISNHM